MAARDQRGLEALGGPMQVLLVDDQPLVLEGLERVIEGTEDFNVVGRCLCGSEALDVAHAAQPDVVVLAIHLDDMDGAEVCRRLAAIAPLCEIVILTDVDDVDSVRRCLDFGAAGVVLRSTTSDRLVAALRLVTAGELVVEPKLYQGLRSLAADGSDAVGVVGPLRPRELQVLRLLATGADTKTIAEDLGLTVNTVRTYIQSTLEKMGAHSRIQAIVIAGRHGLI